MPFWNLELNPCFAASLASLQFLIAAAERVLIPAIKQDLLTLPPPTERERMFLTGKRTWNASWAQQFRILMTCGFKERRHEVWSPLRIGQVLVISFIVGCLWFNSNRNTLTEATDQVRLSTNLNKTRFARTLSISILSHHEAMQTEKSCATLKGHIYSVCSFMSCCEHSESSTALL